MYQKYETLLEKLTEAIISHGRDIRALASEINHISKVIEAAEQTAKSDFIGKKIEKRS